MKDNVRTQARTLRKWSEYAEKAIQKRKPSKKKEQVQEPKIQEVADIEAVPVEEQNIIFKPNVGPQTEFLAAGEREVLYGGSAGGGKSLCHVSRPTTLHGSSII